MTRKKKWERSKRLRCAIRAAERARCKELGFSRDGEWRLAARAHSAGKKQIRKKLEPSVKMGDMTALAALAMMVPRYGKRGKRR